MEKTSHDLISRAMAGDEEAFAELYAEKAKYIYYTALHFCKNPQDAEDVAQEVALRMFRALATLKSPEFFDTWLYSIVYRECRALFRKRSAKKRVQSVAYQTADLEEDREEFLPKEYAENAEKSEALRKAVERLPSKRRAMIVLYYFDNFNCAQIAEITGTSMSTVTSTLTKAKAAIKEDLAKQFGEIPEVVKSFVAVPVLSKILQADADRLFTEKMAAKMANGYKPPVASLIKPLSSRIITGVIAVLASGAVLAGAWMILQKPSQATTPEESTAPPGVSDQDTQTPAPPDFEINIKEAVSPPENSDADPSTASELESLNGVFFLSPIIPQTENFFYPQTTWTTVKGSIILPDSLGENCTLLLCEDGTILATAIVTQNEFCFEPVTLQAGHSYYISATHSGGTIAGAAPVTTAPQGGVSTIDIIIVEK